MRNHFSRNGRYATLVACLLATCGLTWSCKDDYVLDDEKPTWLNSSIFQSLQNRGNFSTYLDLISDSVVNSTLSRKLPDVLSRTGSKTVFVADDDAWDAFFRKNASLPESNPWHNATSLRNLTLAQKKLLIHTSMLNNAIVMENLASSDGNGTNPPVRGEYMRRYTDVELTDSISYLAPSEVPYTTNDSETNFWRRFREGGTHPGIYLVNDSTPSMMLHFTQEHMAKQEVTDADFAIFMGRERQTSDVHIYDALLQEKDNVCENGYVNVTEKVIAPLPNMAEVIRTNGRTNIFSHMLDRYSFPAYNAAVTRDYKILHPEFTDSIFTKKYISSIGANQQAVLKTPEGENLGSGVALKFDPGWNGFSKQAGEARADMATMFVPDDETMLAYFSEGGKGWQLIQTYAENPMAEVSPNDLNTLYQKIDAIPLNTLSALINVIMFDSFTSSVPSKMTSLRDDAQEDMFSPDDINMIDTCLLASNGAIYIMKKVYGPARYTSVAAPANISKTNLVMQWAINNGSVEAEDRMKLNYYAYLLAMKSRFTLFIPSDAALQYYYDPVSMTSQKPAVLTMTYNDKTSKTDQTKLVIDSRLYRYDKETGERGTPYTNEKMANDDVINRLKDILESHTIVHDGTNPIDSEDEYYLTKNGSGVKVTRNEQGTIIGVQGGFQIENERKGITAANGATTIAVETYNTHNMDNGRTYVLDEAPIVPPTMSVYGILNEDTSSANPYSKFFDLTKYNDNVITGCGLVRDDLKSETKTSLLKKFHTFIDDGGVDQNVQFFNNYNYTVFIPDNDAVQDAIDNGLPTWEEIIEEYEALHTQADLAVYDEANERWYYMNDSITNQGTIVTSETDTIWLGKNVTPSDKQAFLHSDSLRFQAKITYLNNFIRAHFLDNSVFADKSAREPAEYVTSSYDNDLGVFVKMWVSRTTEAGRTVLKVQDEHGGGLYSTYDDNNKNRMTRDVHCVSGSKTTSPTNKISMNGLTIQGSSFAVVHLINGVLRHTDLVNGQHKINWNSESECKRYLRKYGIYVSDRQEQAKQEKKQMMHKRF